MSTATATFKAVADFSDLRRQARGLTTELKSVESSASKVGSSFNQTFSKLGTSSRTAASAVGTVGRASSSASHGAAELSKAASVASKSVGSLAQAAANMASSMGPGAGAAAQLATSLGSVGSAATAATVAVGLVTAGVAAMGIQFLATREQSQVAFTTILKDGAKAADLIQRIQDTAAVTPFQTGDLTQSVRQLLAYGFDLDQVLKGTGRTAEGLVITIGNAVAAVGGSSEMLDRVSRAIGQIQTKGRVQGDELRQLAENGIPVFEILREKLGLTAKEVGNIGDQGITASAALKALQEGLDERFGGALEAQSKTFLGLISTIKDNFQILAATGASGLFTSLKSGLEGIGGVLTDLVQQSGEIGFFGVIEQKAPVVAAFLSSLASTFTSLKGVIVSLMPSIKAFVQSFSGALLGSITAGLEIVATALNTIASALDKLPDPLKTALGAALGLSVAFKVLVTSRMAETLLNIGKSAITAAQGLAATTVRLSALKASEGTMAALSSGATLAGGKFAQLATKLTGLGPTAPWVLGLAAGAAALYGLSKLFPETETTVLNTSDAALTLASSLGDKLNPELQNIETSASGAKEEVAGLGAAFTAEFLEANGSTIELLKTLDKLGDGSAEAKLVEIGFQLVQNGETPEQALNSIRQLAEAAGVELPVSLKGDDLRQVELSIKSAQMAAGELVTKFNELQASNNADNSDFGFMTENLNAAEVAADALISQIELLASSGNFSAAVAAAAAYEAELMKLGLTGDALTLQQNRLTDALIASDGVTGQSANNVVSVTDYLLEYGTATTGATVGAQNFANAVAALVAENVPLPDAIAQVAGELTDLKDTTPKVADGLEDVSDAEAEATRYAESLEKSMEDLVEKSKAAQDAFAGFTDVGEVLSSVFGDVSDESKAFAEQAAMDAGLSKDHWKEFADEAGVGIQQFADALEASVIQQQSWGENLLKVAEIYGPATADQLRELGPEAAGIVEQMVNDVTGEGQRLADLLAADAALGSDDLAIEWTAGMDALAKIIEDPDIDPKQLSENIGVPVEALQPLLEKYGGTAGENYVKKFQASLSNGRFVVSTSAIRITGSPVSIPAILKVTTSGTTAVNPFPTNPVNLPGQGAGPSSAAGALDGGIISFAMGGTNKPKEIPPLPENATIKRGTLIQWAEPETGGEAFIPLSPSKRKRSRKLWQDVGKILGTLPANFKMYAVGGINGGREDGTNPFAYNQSRASELGDRRYPKDGAKTSSTHTIKVNVDDQKAKDDLKAFFDAINDQKATIENNKIQMEFDAMDAADQIEFLEAKMKTLESLGLQYSDQWMDAWNQRIDIIKNLQDAVDDAANEMIRLVQAEADLRAEMASVAADAAADIARVQRDAAQALSEIAADAAKARADAEADAAKRSADVAKDYYKSQTKAAEDYARRVEEINKQAAKQAADIEKQFQESLKQRSDSILLSMNAMQRYQVGWGNTTGAVIQNLERQNAALAEYNAGLQQLKARGLTDDAASVLGLNDVGSLGQVRQLLQSTPEEFAKLLQLIESRRAEANAIANNSSSDLVADRDQALADLAAATGETLTELNRTFAESQAEAAATFAENMAEIEASLAERLGEIDADMAERSAEVTQNAAERIEEINQELLKRQAELAEELANLGLEAGMTLGEALAAGLQSALPGVQAAVAAYIAELSRLNQANGVPPIPEGGLGGTTGRVLNPIPSQLANPIAPDASDPMNWREIERLRQLHEFLGLPWDPANPTAGLPVGTFHTGGFVGEMMTGSSLRAGEVLAKLEKGEGVISKETMNDIGRFGGMSLGADYAEWAGGSSSTTTEVPVNIYLDGDLIYESVERRQRQKSRQSVLHQGRGFNRG